MSVRKYFEFVRFEHTVFALPFALAAMAVAAGPQRGWPGWRTFLLILAAMVCARTAVEVRLTVYRCLTTLWL